jgi:hypothetical protein
MVDENATQSGANPGAVMNDVAAVAKQLIAIVLSADHFSRIREKWLFDGAKGFEIARGKLLGRLADPDKDGGIGEPLIRRYLGKGNEENSRRSHVQIRHAIGSLKQTGIYDNLVDEALSKYAPVQTSDVIDVITSPKKTIAKRKTATKRRPKIRILSFEAVFMPYMLTADGRPVIERIKYENLLPPPQEPKVVSIAR